MAKSKKEETEEISSLTPAQQAMSYLKTNKGDHYNFEEEQFYRVPTSSLTVNAMIGGGFAPGAHRAIGVTSGGKTSFTLDGMYHFLKGGKGRMGVYVKAEGRLSKEMRERSGITFVTNPDEWVEGTCFIYESNVFEAIFGFMGDLIRNNPQKMKYYFILDSLDMMAKRDDLAKPLEDAQQVAGGALITSVFLKKTSAALAKRGHFCWFLSQVRDSIKINPYEKGTPRQGSASGGHAVEHAGDYVLEFLPRWNDDVIREGDPKNGKIIGHYCRIKIVKSNNEKNGTEIRYPIRYNRTGCTSVWVEREIVDLLMGWEFMKRSGAWFSFDESIRAEIKSKASINLPEKIQGLDNVYAYFEGDKAATKFFYDKFLSMFVTQE